MILSSQTTAVRQKELTAYEVGVKAAMFDRRLRINAAAFYYDYRDKQFSTFVLTPIGSVNASVDIPKSSVKGFDVDVAVVPVGGLTLSGALTYIDTRVGAFVSRSFAGDLVDYRGTEFNFAPALFGTTDAEHRFALSGDLDGVIGAGLLYNSRTFADLGEVASTRIPAYTILNAHAGLRSGKGWSLTGWIRNLTDKYYWTNVGPGGDTQFKYSGLPRTYGLTAQFDF